jgi:hypothetical protein
MYVFTTYYIHLQTVEGNTMHYFRYALITAVLFYGLLFPVYAQRAPHNVSLTISPLHLIGPIVELTGEFKMEDDIGVAAVVGVGSLEGFSVFEVGGQFNYYVIGSFQHGMQLGAEMLYISLSDDYRNTDVDISAVGRGLAVGPYLGYKVAAGFGLTFNLQAGVYASLMKASAEDDMSGARASASGSSGGLLLNLNLGWSF